MTEIVLESKIYDILKNFIKDEKIDFQKELNKFNKSDLDFRIKYEKYDSSITYPLAKIIINLQESVYKTASLFYYNVKDIRKLTNKQKQDLELVFKISKGSSIEEITNYKEIIMEILKMIPEDDRSLCFIVLIIFVTGFFSWSKYLKYKTEKNRNDLDAKNESEKNNIINNAINKISEMNEKLFEIIKENEINNINALKDLDNKIEIQGIEYTKEDLEHIKKIKNKEKIFKKKKEEKSLEVINGYYKIITIDNENNNIILENVDGGNDIKKVYYIPDGDLFNKIEEIKKSVGNSSKIFKIKIKAVKKEEKIDTLILENIEEAKQ